MDEEPGLKAQSDRVNSRSKTCLKNGEHNPSRAQLSHSFAGRSLAGGWLRATGSLHLDRIAEVKWRARKGLVPMVQSSRPGRFSPRGQRGSDYQTGLALPEPSVSHIKRRTGSASPGWKVLTLCSLQNYFLVYFDALFKVQRKPVILSLFSNSPSHSSRRIPLVSNNFAEDPLISQCSWVYLRPSCQRSDERFYFSLSLHLQRSNPLDNVTIRFC